MLKIQEIRTNILKITVKQIAKQMETSNSTTKSYRKHLNMDSVYIRNKTKKNFQRSFKTASHVKAGFSHNGSCNCETRTSSGKEIIDKAEINT